jgi:site-specific recombinase XerD
MNILLGCRVYRNQLIPPFPLRESFVPYDLRHTFCTDLARKGVDIRIAQKLMGHSSINITSDIYTHVDSQQILSEAIKILGKNVK